MIALRPCPWWVRWFHRRQRRADRKVMWKAICDSTDDGAKRAEAWLIFLGMPGQQHWFCACARADGRRVEDSHD